MGYGTVTPSAHWSYFCDYCIDKGLMYDWPEAPDNWPTPIPEEEQQGGQPSESDKDTILYTGTTRLWTVDGIDNPDHPYFLPDTNYTNWGNHNGLWWGKSPDSSTISYTNSIDINYRLQQTTPNGICNYTTLYGFRIENYYSDSLTVTITGDIEDQFTLEYSQYKNIVIHSFTSCHTYDQIKNFNIEWESVTKGTSHPDIYISPYNYRILSAHDFIFDIEFIWKQGPKITQTQSQSYCNEIVEEDTEDKDAIFGIPSIGLGETTCYNLGGFTIPLGWLSVLIPSIDDWIVPSASFCFTPINFGNLNLFGISIDLDFIAFAMAGVLLIRLILRS